MTWIAGMLVIMSDVQCFCVFLVSVLVVIAIVHGRFPRNVK